MLCQLLIHWKTSWDTKEEEILKNGADNGETLKNNELIMFVVWEDNTDSFLKRD